MYFNKHYEIINYATNGRTIITKIFHDYFHQTIYHYFYYNTIRQMKEMIKILFQLHEQKHCSEEKFNTNRPFIIKHHGSRLV